MIVEWYFLLLLHHSHNWMEEKPHSYLSLSSRLAVSTWNTHTELVLQNYTQLELCHWIQTNWRIWQKVGIIVTPQCTTSFWPNQKTELLYIVGYMQTCNIWHNMLSRICQSIGSQFKFSVFHVEDTCQVSLRKHKKYGSSLLHNFIVHIRTD